MDWFKHKTNSFEDPDFSLIMDTFGDAGYIMFFGLLEIYGKEYSNTDPDGFLHVSLAFVARKLRKNSVKVQKFLRYCEKSLSKPRFVSRINGNILAFKAPDFIEISSNWTKRKKKAPTEAPTEAPTAIRSKKKEVRSKKKEYKRDNIPPCPQKEIIKLYNEILPSLPAIDFESWPASSQKQLRMRWRENPKRQYLENWKKFFEYIKKSEFLMGDNDREWTADLFWIVNPKNFAKILSGKYHKNQKNKLSPYEEFINERIKE